MIPTELIAPLTGYLNLSMNNIYKIVVIRCPQKDNRISEIYETACSRDRSRDFHIWMSLGHFHVVLDVASCFLNLSIVTSRHIRTSEQPCKKCEKYQQDCLYKLLTACSKLVDNVRLAEQTQVVDSL